MNMAFGGAKIALYLGDRLVVILRDDHKGLPFAGCWDLPGGGREGREAPFDCVQRECFEELGLMLPKAAIVWHRAFVQRGVTNWFFVGHLPAATSDAIVFGDEGQCWKLMTDADYIAHERAVPTFQHRLRLYLLREGGEGKNPPQRCGGR